jgi:hypothetical protein
MQQGTTTMSEVYCKTLKKLCRAIWKKRHEKPTSGVVFLHDNVHPYTPPCAQALLEHFDWELFHHPPYSPDFALSDYHLFTYLKNWLQSQCSSSNLFCYTISASIPAVTTLLTDSYESVPIQELTTSLCNLLALVHP